MVSLRWRERQGYAVPPDSMMHDPLSRATKWEPSETRKRASGAGKWPVSLEKMRKDWKVKIQQYEGKCRVRTVT